MRWFFRLLHILYVGQALARGPRDFGRYELRRQARRLVDKATRGPRRKHL